MTKPKKLLICDDSLFIRNVLKDSLSKNYEVIEVDLSQDALDQFKEVKPDIVLMDILVPGGEYDGINFVKKVMELDPSTQVVVVTAMEQTLVIEEGRKLGAEVLVLKPFEEIRVIEIINKYFKGMG